jgi:aa3 type cytochrome c oxidase subunit IV
MRDEDAIDMQEAGERHEAMDYVQHEKTWANVTNLVKWSIIQLAFIVVGLYTSVIAGQTFWGVLLIVIGLIAPLGAYFFWPRRVV